jgi:hypothetical protein
VGCGKEGKCLADEFLKGAEPLTDCDFAGGPLCNVCLNNELNGQTHTAAEAEFDGGDFAILDGGDLGVDDDSPWKGKGSRDLEDRSRAAELKLSAETYSSGKPYASSGSTTLRGGKPRSDATLVDDGLSGPIGQHVGPSGSQPVTGNDALKEDDEEEEGDKDGSQPSEVMAKAKRPRHGMPEVLS